MARRRISLRKIVFERAQGRCEYCKSPAAFAHQSFSLVHVQPRSRKGKRSFTNLALSCQGCNNHKYNRVKLTIQSQAKMLACITLGGTAGRIILPGRTMAPRYSV
jgi:5-methylcytosine-specific restriction endonuclease McrA